MPFQKTWQNRVTTPIPPSVDPTALVSILHDHGFLITMSPIVTRYEQAGTESPGSSTSPPSDGTSGEKISYDVWENIDFIPGGLVRKEISFKCAFENTQDGVISWIQAPMGLTSRAAYRVKLAEGEEGGWVLDERIESSCSLFLKAFVEKTMVNTRKEMHGRLVEKARERKEVKEEQL